jgi:hypothetical protein
MRRAVAALLAIPALQAAYAALFRSLLRRAVERLVAGDVDAFLRFYADDAQRFLERFVRVGLTGGVHESP